MTTATTPARKAAAKAPAKPQDRKPKAAPVDEGVAPEELTIVRTLVVEGVAISTSLEFMNDFEFAEDAADVEDGQVQLVPRLMRRSITDPDAYRRVKAHLRNEDSGRIDLDRGAEFFMAYMTAVREAIEAEQDAAE